MEPNSHSTPSPTPSADHHSRMAPPVSAAGNSQTAPPPPPDTSHSTPPAPGDSEETLPDSQGYQSAATTAATTSAIAVARKRKRRRKPYSAVVPPLAHRSRSRSRRRDGAIDLRSGSSRLARELDEEALIAAAIGFPSDSLADEEIDHAVVPTIGGGAQTNYTVVRNHIISLWRLNSSSPVTPSSALRAIRSNHSDLVSSAISFLSSHAFINFNPSIHPRLPPDSSETCVIIGAGLSGLAAARQLITLGLKVIILEGRNRAGGRVFTKRMTADSVSAAADLGGSVLTGINGNPLGVFARQMGFPLHKVRDKCPLYLPSGRPVDPSVDARVEAAFNSLLDKACKLRETILDELNSSVDVSLGVALEAFRKAYAVIELPEERMLLDWHLANLEYANATKLSDLSMAFWDQDDPYEMGGDHCFIPGGNGRFVRALAENVPILYGLTVRRIQYGCDGVMVYTEDGQIFRGDMALCTVPLGVLKKGTIEFVPPLPQHKQDAIQRLGFGLLNKVAMLFPYDFWGGGIDTFGHLTEETSDRGEFFLFYSYVSVSGGPLLVALVAGESAIKFEKTSPVEHVNKVLEVLRGIFAPKGIEVPAPLQVICTRWGSDKFSYGSYSYVAVGSSGDDYDILAECVGDGRVFFSGEATNRRYPATMHGALLSGFREAANMSRAAKKRSTVVQQTEKIDDVKGDENFDLDILFQRPDQSFGSFSVLYDPEPGDPESLSLIRVAIGERKLGSRSLFLYGLISRKNVMELGEIDGDDNRLSMLYRNFGTKLVGWNGLSNHGESLIARIKSTRQHSLKNESVNGDHHV